MSCVPDQNWVTAELARSAPNAKILDEHPAYSRNPGQNLKEYLTNDDALFRTLQVTIDAMKDEQGLIHYTLSVEFYRNVYLSSGSTIAPV